MGLFSKSNSRQKTQSLRMVYVKQNNYIFNQILRDIYGADTAITEGGENLVQEAVGRLFGVYDGRSQAVVEVSESYRARKGLLDRRFASVKRSVFDDGLGSICSGKSFLGCDLTIVFSVDYL
eukprot:TRINITY_DN5259_c1_g1_i1.p3 TRINITY_DN5259_c1_g1~~TRINITY_DN5259_c1_g1_i1.p3  ORF type:complete len:122 (-),score=11.94 TRINITY_DN5259_c1_g1_i1:97-462(-)